VLDLEREDGVLTCRSMSSCDENGDDPNNRCNNPTRQGYRITFRYLDE
jgi:hypothetical protein